MSVSTADLMGLAYSLQTGSIDEVQQRAVVGRAYYAAYHDVTFGMPPCHRQALRALMVECTPGWSRR